MPSEGPDQPPWDRKILMIRLSSLPSKNPGSFDPLCCHFQHFSLLVMVKLQLKVCIQKTVSTPLKKYAFQTPEGVNAPHKKAKRDEGTFLP
jgi:hypothetical protein